MSKLQVATLKLIKLKQGRIKPSKEKVMKSEFLQILTAYSIFSSVMYYFVYSNTQYYILEDGTDINTIEEDIVNLIQEVTQAFGNLC